MSGAGDRSQRADIHERELRLSAILETAVDAIVTINREGVILDANPATAKMFGYSQEEIIGNNVNMFMPAPYHDEHGSYIQRYLETREPRIIGLGREVTARRKDGSTFPAHLAVSEEDHLQVFTGIVRDLTELKVAQEKLVQSERLAVIGEMMAALAHESRNALQRTRACLEMLELDLDGQPESIDLVRRGQTALDELNRLYEEVRSYAAPVKLSPVECDLSHIWETAWTNLGELRRNRQVRFDARPEGVALTCWLDHHRVGQVVRNLLENAISAVPDPGEIALECADADIDGRAAVRMVIRDNGPGFDDEQRRRAFEPFFTTKTKGTGLGMAIAKRIVEAHGGTIEVGNAIGGGAEVVATLPRTPLSPDASREQQSPTQYRRG